MFENAMSHTSPGAWLPLFPPFASLTAQNKVTTDLFRLEKLIENFQLFSLSLYNLSWESVMEWWREWEFPEKGLLWELNCHKLQGKKTNLWGGKSSLRERELLVGVIKWVRYRAGSLSAWQLEMELLGRLAFSSPTLATPSQL